MGLDFPNRNRSFDAKRCRIRFWGYDSAIEITFIVEADALKKFSPELRDAEAEFLQVFDACRGRIHEVAAIVYKAGGGGSYTFVLMAKDF